MASLHAAAVIALKPIEHAKSRLAVPDPLRRRLAWTMALDTLTALSRALPHVLVVSDQPALEARLRRAELAVEVISESGHVGMNSALTRGALSLHAEGFVSVLACVGDLPALRPESVALILDALNLQIEPISQLMDYTILITWTSPLFCDAKKKKQRANSHGMIKFIS